MSQKLEASDWIAARGDKWRAQLTGMESMLMPINEPLLDALKLDGPVRVAEIGCGGGGTALEILRLAPAGSVVHGFDISPALVEAARMRLPAGERALTFTQADMSKTAPEATYDRLVSRFGVMFFDDPEAAFVSLARWLGRGGRFAFAVWGPPAENPWTTIVRDVIGAIVPLPETDPDAPGPFRYADAQRFAALLDRAGFAELDVREWRGALALGGGLPPAEAAEFALAAFGSFSELLSNAGSAAESEARRSLVERLSHHRDDGVVRLSACVRIVTGASRA